MNTLPTKKDKHKYDSNNEEYDSEDYAKTMALGTMICQKGKFPLFICTNNGINNLLAHGFLIQKAQSEVYYPFRQ